MNLLQTSFIGGIWLPQDKVTLIEFIIQASFTEFSISSASI